MWDRHLQVRLMQQHNTAVMRACCSGWAAVTLQGGPKEGCLRTISYCDVCVVLWVSSEAFLMSKVMLVLPVAMPLCPCQAHQQLWKGLSALGLEPFVGKPTDR